MRLAFAVAALLLAGCDNRPLVQMQIWKTSARYADRKGQGELDDYGRCGETSTHGHFRGVDKTKELSRGAACVDLCSYIVINNYQDGERSLACQKACEKEAAFTQECKDVTRHDPWARGYWSGCVPNFSTGAR